MTNVILTWLLSRKIWRDPNYLIYISQLRFFKLQVNCSFFFQVTLRNTKRVLRPSLIHHDPTTSSGNTPFTRSKTPKTPSSSVLAGFISPAAHNFPFCCSSLDFYGCLGFCNCSWRNYFRSPKSSSLYWRSRTFVLSTFLPHNLLPPTKDSLPRVNPRVASAKDFSSHYAVPQFVSYTQAHTPY